MKLYTSYWAKVRDFPKNLIGLNTTIWPPRWRPLGQDKRGVWVIDCPPLKPGKQCAGLCYGKCNPKHPQDCAFLKAYKQQLDDEITPDFFTTLNNLAGQIKIGEHLEDVDFAFIVFEKYDNPCSERWPIQEWFKEHNIEIEEWHQREEKENENE